MTNAVSNKQTGTEKYTVPFTMIITVNTMSMLMASGSGQTDPVNPGVDD